MVPANGRARRTSRDVPAPASDEGRRRNRGPHNRDAMHVHTLVAFTAVAAVAILSPGPATLLALRNSMAWGPRTAVWSTLGNVCGLFGLSAAAMLGLGVLLQSSALLFGAVKLLGAGYLFYVGARQLAGRGVTLVPPAGESASPPPARRRLFGEALLTASTNPKPILFFTALFPQFLDAHAPLLPQFLVLTGLFCALSFTSLATYALLASRARALLARPRFSLWLDRSVGAIFVGFGAALLALRRQAA
jgi:threonine/homoserine/homoserine lactone efflux protein